MKRRISCFILAFVMMIGIMPAAGNAGKAYATGTLDVLCSDENNRSTSSLMSTDEEKKFTYNYDEDTKTLTFSGDGLIFLTGNAKDDEWIKYRLTAEKIVINEGIEGVGSYALWNSEKVTEIVFPESMYFLRDDAFANCDKLKEVHLPDGITTYGWGVFEECKELETVYFGNEPENEVVNCVQTNIFKGCPKLKNIFIPRGNSAFSLKDGVLFAETTLIYYPQTKTDSHYEIPEGTTAIGENAFYCNEYMETVTIPDTVTCLWYGFSNCTALTSLTIPASVTHVVRESVFGSCHKLQYVKNNSTIDIEFDSNYHPNGMAYWVDRETGKYVKSIADGTADRVILGDDKYQGEIIRVDGVTFRLLENTKNLTVDEMNEGAARATVKAVKFADEYTISSKIKHKGWYYEVTNPDASPVSAISGAAVKYTTARLVKGDYDAIYAKWNKVTALGATVSYKVEYKKQGGKWGVLENAAVNNNRTIKDLADGVRYYIRVTPHVTVNGETHYGKAKISTAVCTLKKINKPNVIKAGKDKVKITWNNINGETGYEIYKSTKMNKDFKLAKRVISSTAKSAVLKSDKNAKYYYKVRAYKNIKVNGGIYKVYAPWSKVRGFKLK